MRVEQYVMAYGVEQDRLRAILPDRYESLRPVLRINAEIRDHVVGYVELNTAVSKDENKEVCENISRMTYAYINPDTKQPTVVPSKHYKDILDQAVEVLVNDQVKKQFLNIMFKQMKTLKEEEPILFNETLLLMDWNKTPDSLELNEEAALKITPKKIGGK